MFFFYLLSFLHLQLPPVRSVEQELMRTCWCMSEREKEKERERERERERQYWSLN
jgi:hypothetical protein